MDAKEFTAGLADLRSLRDDIKKAEAALQKKHNERDKRIKALAGYPKAKPERLAPAAGLSVRDIVTLAPHLAPAPATDTVSEAGAPAASSSKKDLGVPGAQTPDLTPVTAHTIEKPTEPVPATRIPEAAAELEEAAPEEPAEKTTTPVAPADAPAPTPRPDDEPVPRQLPVIPDGEVGDRWFTVAPNLRSEHPKFSQAVRPTVFLDASTGDLIHRDQRIRLDLGHATPDEILTAVFAHVPDSVERIYITAGDPWHRDADRHAYLTDAVRAWLHASMPGGWTVESRRGNDRMAGHFIHERRPVGRWERGNQHVEIRSIGEWFDTEEADVATVRHAFTLVWEALKKFWPDVVLMGSPSQTGRDLWTRTIPTKQGSRWSDGYPVMSDEIRQLLHHTSGQGRTELITPPLVPDPLPQLFELDRTLAYGKHTWTSGVGAPQRVTARTFASWNEKQQTDALFAPSHWHIKVTIPDDWNHVGILPAAIEGDRAWMYPHEAGRTFTTWAGGAEVNAALRNPIRPWKIEILDGLLWKAGQPLKTWSGHLKDAWAGLAATAQHAGSEDLRQAYRLASRAVRSILLYGIGGFAQRPTTTTGTVPIGSENQIPKGAHVRSISGDTVTWERTVISRNPNAHPEWAAGVWSAARAALLSTRTKNADGQTVHVGALHLPPGSIVAFRTDAIYTMVNPGWPYSGEPGDYRIKGALTTPWNAPQNESDFYRLQALGRASLEEQQEA
ncbi:Mucin-19 [Streptomyces xantholiticus]